MTITEFRFDDHQLEPTVPDVVHRVVLTSGDTVAVVGANAYQPEGPMTTFFATGSARGTIDSWSVRVASYRTTDIVSIVRSDAAAEPAFGADTARHRAPSLVAV
jgi:hypothetical protein